jgi:GR25 family glycosyltransferase involved in LPS biosynthesis
MLFNKIYLINLLRKPENLSKMFDILAKSSVLGEIPIDVVEAHDGENIDEEYLENIDAKAWPYWKDPWFGRAITKGEIGCALSHNEAWKRIVEREEEFALVLEDDAVLDKDFLKQCEEIQKQFSKKKTKKKLEKI